MKRQNEITEKTKLLTPEGDLANPGWCRHNLYEYNREDIKAPLWRVKEWDFYQFSDGEWVIQLNCANISIATFASADVYNVKTNEKFSCIGLSFFTKKRYPMPRNGETPYEIDYVIGGMHIKYKITETLREFYYKGKVKGKDLIINLSCENDIQRESITIATPFDLKKRFFYTQKINCMPTKGNVKIGDRTITLGENAFGVLDWGRGPWPYKNVWYWGNGTTYIDGKLFGFEITWGIGNEENATETCLFYDGKAHKIGGVDVVEHPKKKGWLEPWVFKGEDGRFELTMTPIHDNATSLKIFNILGTVCHQVHGYFNGYVILDDGRKLEVKDMFAFCEYMENRW